MVEPLDLSGSGSVTAHLVWLFETSDGLYQSVRRIVVHLLAKPSEGNSVVRPQLRRRLAALSAVTLTAAGLSLTSSPVAAAECPDQLPSCVVVSVVETVGGQTHALIQYTVSPEDLQAIAEPELTDRHYTLRKNPASKGGTLDERPFAQGQRVSINKLLTTLDPALVGTATYFETPNAAGIPSVLSAADLADPAAAADAYPFVDKLPPAVFLTGSGKVGYIRPMRNPDEDANASDYTQGFGRLDLTIHTTGTLLAPVVGSSGGTDLDTGSETTFSVTYPDKPKARVKSTRWDFGDGSTRGTKRNKPSKSFAKRGTYPVVVTVRTNDGSYGRSTPLEIKVGKPPKAPAGGNGGGTGDGSGSGGGPGVTGGGLPPPFDPFEGDVDPPDSFEEPPVDEGEPEPELEPAPVDDGLVPVEGYVLAGAEIVPGGTPETIPGTQTPTTPAPATQASTRQRIATWAVAALAIVLLVGLGAASETRWFRRRLPHFRRRA